MIFNRLYFGRVQSNARSLLDFINRRRCSAIGAASINLFSQESVALDGSIRSSTSNADVEVRRSHGPIYIIYDRLFQV